MRPHFRQDMLRLRLRHAAQSFAEHGWAVTPGGYFNGERMACDFPTCWATSCHPLLPDWDHRSAADESLLDWWRVRPHSVLLPTGRQFDVIEVPQLLGAKVRAPFGPIGVLPSGRWMFLVRSGVPLRPELEQRIDIVLHGTGSWVPAPPTVLPEGPVRWQLSPRQVQWRMPDSGEVQRAMVSALVALDASFLDLPLTARKQMSTSPAFGRPASTVETALRRAA